MIQVLLEGHDFNYDIEELLKAVFPNTIVNFVSEQAQINEKGLFVIAKLNIYDDIIVTMTEVYDRGQVAASNSISDTKLKDIQQHKRQQKRLIKVSILKALQDILDVEMPWGILVGVRPVKLVHQYRNRGYDYKQISSLLGEQYLIRPDKIKLMLEFIR